MKQLTIIQFLRLSFLATVSLLWSAGVTAMPIYTTTIVTDGVVANVDIEFQKLTNGGEDELTVDLIKDITLTSNGITLSFDSISEISGSARKSGGTVSVSDLILKATNTDADELYIGSNGSYYNIVTTGDTGGETTNGTGTKGGRPDITPAGFTPGDENNGARIPEPPMLALILAGLFGITGSRMIRRHRNQST